MLDILSKSLLELPLYFTDANKRIFAIYLVSAIVLSIPVFYKVSHTKSLPEFFKFLLPKDVWLHESAKQDYKLWVLNKILKAFLFGPIVLTMVPIALGLSNLFESSFGTFEPFKLAHWQIIAIFTTALFLVDDFTRESWLGSWNVINPLSIILSYS